MTFEKPVKRYGGYEKVRVRSVCYGVHLVGGKGGIKKAYVVTAQCDNLKLSVINISMLT